MTPDEAMFSGVQQRALARYGCLHTSIASCLRNMMLQLRGDTRNALSQPPMFACFTSWFVVASIVIPRLTNSPRTGMAINLRQGDVASKTNKRAYQHSDMFWICI